MWTIEQAVKHYETLASRLEDVCLKPASEYPKQTAAWLRELKERRKAPEIIRCGECIYRYVEGNHVRFNRCELNHNNVQSDDWYCADAERKTDENTV